MPNSAIYEGFVKHLRFQPQPHGFRYKVFMMYLDLDELPDLFNNSKNWSYATKNWAWFKRSDYYGDAQKSLKQEISTLVQEATGSEPRGAIRLLTNMRYFGHCFNPVSFYYCYEADGVTLQAIVSHITNTPWGEDYAYVHDFNHDSKTGKTIKKTRNGEISIFKFNKQFHVSPFMPMDIQYDWAFKQEANQLLIHMKNFNNGQQVFNATLALERKEITQSSLNWILIHYPFMTIKVVTAIYWNALMLWIKRVPFYSNPIQVTK
ncbi:DUF1365 domain-containing protein [Methylotenera sp.]|uniref:DUF1365 domain-containing protein n=1 Tax=Methylotenera sp. TaxID=2051956 RepID=UPI0024897D0E|nr:DUF1365 domain-containing protein [Methylotenera sp.]MDI1362459.1 DUF1365 domain-containing protein [Methylotenera sp.]